MGDDRPNVYLDDTTDKWVYRASSLGNCVKGLVAARLQYEAFPFPDWLLEKFEQGNAAETMLIKRFLDHQHGNDTWVMLDPETESSYVNADHTFYPHVNFGGSHDSQFTCEVPVGTTAVIRGHMTVSQNQMPANVLLWNAKRSHNRIGTNTRRTVSKRSRTMRHSCRCTCTQPDYLVCSLSD